MKNACHLSYQAEEDYLLWIPPRCAPWSDCTVSVVPCHPPQGVQPCPTKPHHSIPHWESLSCRCSILRKLSHSCHCHSTTPPLFSSLVLLVSGCVPVLSCDFLWRHKPMSTHPRLGTDRLIDSSPQLQFHDPVILLKLHIVSGLLPEWLTQRQLHPWKL